MDFLQQLATKCNEEPLYLFKSLILFYDDVKKCKKYSAIKDSATNLRLENKLMSTRESYLLALRNRRYLLQQLFETPDPVSD